MNKRTERIRELASNLLKEGTVEMVIGFGRGTTPMATRPDIARTPEDVEKLVWNSNCSLNLANYLTDRKGQIGIIAKGCDSRNIVNHIVENKILREQLYIIGVPCTGMVDKVRLAALCDEEILEYTEDGEGSITLKTASGKKEAAKEDYLKPNCATCMHRNPVIYDDLAADLVDEPEIEDQFADVKAIEAMAPKEKWDYFDDLVNECIRCYACRNACPLCFCPTCFVDESGPQWVGKGQSETDVKTFHFLRAYHCAGRCTDCGACVEACPMDINVRAFTRKLVKDSLEIYDWEAGLDMEKRPPLDTFNPNDPDDFIK
ncbi:MAG TPA: 4Fe-4S dicluster domain-containing protein [Desulfobacteraceae bacterium]|nr:4Fe-4S dicluster domain-containing protein [Desulfobacteraceae bacterium]